MFNILVVDDNHSIRKLMTTYLVRDGYKVFRLRWIRSIRCT